MKKRNIKCDFKYCIYDTKLSNSTTTHGSSLATVRLRGVAEPAGTDARVRDAGKVV